MQPSRHTIAALIERFKNGTCTPEELTLLQDWMAALDLTTASDELTQEVQDGLKTRMHRQLMQEFQAAPVVNIQRKGIVRRLVAAAAIVVAIVSGTVLWYMSNRQGAREHKSIALAIIDNNQNVVRKVTMPDGTVIWLNRHSSIEFDQEQYNHTNRYVKLSGEGFFEVTKDASRPFIVETGLLQTKVLGTAFNIEAYRQETEIRVSLVHGKVALENKSKSVSAVLAPNQVFRYSKQTGEWQLIPMPVSNINAWTQGALVLNEVPLEEAIQRIADRYQLVFSYDKALLSNKRITATFIVNDWEYALRNILFVHGLDFHIKKGIVIITP